MDIEISEIREDIFLLQFSNQYNVASTFMRMQEYYESPYRGIKGCYFTLEEYMDRYAKENGNFTYTEDWSGFNIPGNIVRSFFVTFNNNLINKEEVLYNKIIKLLDREKDFYLLGISDDEDLSHEISHGYYYLDEEYRNNMNSITANLDINTLIKIKKILKNLGYCDKVLKDEIQAYLSTEDKFSLCKEFKFPNIKKYANKYIEVFKEKEKFKL